MLITICGSMAFLEQMEKVKYELENMGHQVHIPQLFQEETLGDGEVGKPWQNSDGTLLKYPEHSEIWKQKKEAFLYYFEKVTEADAILVANYPKKGIDGYIGGNVLMEMGLALYLDKPIYMLFDPGVEDVTYGEEILGSMPIIINNDLSLIK